ncbi:hypothetical protein AAFF_G00136840 [Aldrovandia affinis]|uniref:Uncharacterized protein n=1 Tax=Aldrovandia affinis TaxID=143900 RepID=A0AAD7X2K6_9TELE|nr:hypothetical protein AAFF_G00136840 [Aldrovandia affinis]
MVARCITEVYKPLRQQELRDLTRGTHAARGMCAPINLPPSLEPPDMAESREMAARVRGSVSSERLPASGTHFKACRRVAVAARQRRGGRGEAAPRLHTKKGKSAGSSRTIPQYTGRVYICAESAVCQR